MENTNYVDTIDISNVYVWRKNHVSYLVELKEEKAIEKSSGGMEFHGYKVTLTDIFSKKIIYEKFFTVKIGRIEEIIELGVRYTTSLTPIYADKQVPRYVLLQIYYNLNNIDLTSPALKNNK